MSVPVVELVPLTEVAAPLVDGWLRADHVRRYWGDPARIAAELADLPPGAHVRLIAAEGREVGLILWQHPPRAELDQAGLEDVPTSAIDIDIMVGDAGQIGRGIGPAAIRLVVERVLADQAVPFVMAATRLDNSASRRAFAKVGFREDREFDDPGYGRAVLMVLERSSIGG